LSHSIHGYLKAVSLSVVIATSSLVAQTAAKTSPKISVAPKVRITEQINSGNVVSVAHSHAPLVDHLKDMGRVPANTMFHHMHLVLKSSDEQEFALQGFLDQQQDHTHANYHQWLTPETFASSFGVHPADIAKITSWLQSSGLTVEKVARGSRIIDFSGTSGAVESAFHTEMHQYTVNGETRISNSTDISIPHALASVVVGPGALNNFRPKHDLYSYKIKLDQNGKVISRTPVGNTPQLSTTGDLPYDQGIFVGAADLATIYNTNPLLAKGYNGKGVSIGIVAESDILMSDVQVYRAIFGLPVNQPTFLNVGKDPGIPYTGDDGESDLDVELSGALAPGASIVFVIGSQDGEQFGGVGAGVDSAAEYLVDNNLTDIISSSYGLDELDLGADGIAFYGALWEEAAAQGQSVFEASGDNGPDEYDDGASYGSYYSVDGDSTTPWNVAVGGTEFNEGSSFNTASTATTGSTYWGPYSTSIPYGSAKSYIPEQPWNDTRYGLQAQNGDYVIGDMVAETSGVSYWWQIPSWQTGFGVPTSDPTPPVGTYPSFSAPYGRYSITGLKLTNDGAGYTSNPTLTIAPPTCAPLGTATCAQAQGTATATLTGRNAGKVTAVALANPGAGYTAVPAVTITGGGGTGATATATLSPSSFQVPGPHRLVPDVSMNASVYHDGTIYCTEGGCDQYPNGALEDFYSVGGTSVAAPSMAGVQALVNQYNGGRQGNPNYYYYRLSNMQSQTACVANANYVTTSGCSFHDSQAGNNFVPATSGTANYIGWATGAGFDMAIGLGSPDVTNLATNWKTANFNATTTALNLTTASGSSVITGNPMDTYNVLVSVYPVAGTAGANGAPTGDVSIIAATNVGGSIAYFTLSGNAPGGGSSTGGTITALPAGTYNIYAHYGGDTVYGGSNSAPVQVTINQSPVTLAVQVNDLDGLGDLFPSTNMGYSQDTVIFTGILPPSNTTANVGYPVPTGTVTYTISNGTTNVSVATVPVDPNGYQIGSIYYNAAAEYDAGEGFELYVTQPNAPPLPAGNYTVTAAYSGDRTFLPTSATANFTITPVFPTTETGFNLNYTYLGTFSSLSTEVPTTGTATFNVVMDNPLGTAGCLPPTGLVTFTDVTANKVLGTTTLTNIGPNGNSSASFTTAPGAFSTTGTHSISMTYGGDNNFSPWTTNGNTTYLNANLNVWSNVNITVGGTPAGSITLAATPTSGTANYLQRVTLTATLPTSVTAGTVYFFDNSTGSPTGTPVELGSGRVSASTHTATYSTYALLAGTHSFTAEYGGSGTVGTVTTAAPTPYVLNKNTPILSIGGGINGDVGTGYAFQGNWTPNTTGTQYYAAPNYLDGDELTVAPTAAFELIDTTNNNAVVASAIPQYQYAIYSPYYIANGTATATGGSGLAALVPGYHQLAGYYVGDANYGPATSATYAVAVGITGLTLGSSTTNIGIGEPITLTATVVPSYPTTTTVTGTVKFYDNGTLLGTYPATNPATTVIAVKPVGTVPVAYVATLTTTLTTVGAHTITAVYSGDSHFYTSTGTLASPGVTAVTPAFTLYIDPASPTSLTITRGTSGSFNIDALVVGNWTGTAPLVCEGLPANSYCTFTFPGTYNPPSYFSFGPGTPYGPTSTAPYTKSNPLGDGVYGPVQVTITTFLPHEKGATGAGMLWLPALLFAAALGMRRKQLTLRQRQLMVLAILLCGSLATTACSSLGMATPGGSYTVQVQANGIGSTSASPNIQPLLNVPLTLTVQ
jgi:hypothetical protein